MERLHDLPSASVWELFQEISSIPRASGNEAAVSKWIAEYAAKRGAQCIADQTGNLIITARATPGYENAPSLCFQAHMDMVAVQDPGHNHDFTSDPIALSLKEIDGELFVCANHTTLGADDGIGVAMALAFVTDHDNRHGPLEALLTVGEEVSMVGIKEVRDGLLRSKMMINIDSEKDDEVIIGAAGGADAEFTLKPTAERKMTQASLKIELSGFTGGHSGIEIHFGRANAIKSAAGLAQNLVEKFNLSLVSIDGGRFRNAIPISASVVLAGTESEISRAEGEVEIIIDEMKKKYSETDPDITVITTRGAGQDALSLKDSKNIISAICSIPDGVISMNDRFEDTVETSSNLGIISTGADQITAVSLLRSLSSTEELKKMMKKVAALHSSEVAFSNDYACWTPSPYSPLLKMYEKIYEDSNFRKPRVTALHAGVECGILKEKYPEMDIISIGPTILGAHTTRERLSVSSVEKIYGLLLELLEEVSEQR
jgi:dipeptidase D